LLIFPKLPLLGPETTKLYGVKLTTSLTTSPARAWSSYLKFGFHSFSAWRSALKRNSLQLRRQVRLLCPWARHLTRLPITLSGYRLAVTDGSLTRRP